MKTKYDKIGVSYNQTRKADNEITERLIFHLHPEKGKRYLDLGCGTGNYTIALHDEGVQIMGIDPSDVMISNARFRNEEVEWKTGAAENTGLPSESVDGILCVLTIHHWTDLNPAFKEMARILRRNGRVVLFTSTPEQMKGYWLNHYFPDMLKDSIQQMPSFKRVKSGLEKAGFENVKAEKYFVSDELQDCFLYCGKHRPGLYLREEIRNGISSFSDLANRAEIKRGLSKLNTDIQAGNINTVIRNFENEKGDYLFVCSTRAD
jgi:ubiquinone/menaquinone biosynthesis C-methylase UbiE